MKQRVLIAHNLRSAHNVGSLLRTADGLGVNMIYLSGYTPYPQIVNDQRLPHLAKKMDDKIAKTALGAEKNPNIHWVESIDQVIAELRASGFTIAALEQAASSIKLSDYQPADKLALIVGREVEGLEANVLKNCDLILEIPMRGQKESFNVSVAAAIALYNLSLGP